MKMGRIMIENPTKKGVRQLQYSLPLVVDPELVAGTGEG
jgi:hypothetical protein